MKDMLTSHSRAPIIASSLTVPGKTFPFDFIGPGAEKKTAEFCFNLAKDSIERAEKEYNCEVVGFVSDNEPKMKAVRALLVKWRPHLIVYGCSAHYLNLVESNATPSSIMASIVSVNKFFQDHHQPMQMLKAKGGLMPQLPNQTRWTSQRAALLTFIENHQKMLEIRDENKSLFKPEIKRFLDNRLLLVEVRNMIQQLDCVSCALNIFQSDKSDLSQCVLWWLKLMNDEDLHEDLRDEVKRRATEALSPQHLIAFMLDNRIYDDGDEENNQPRLSQDQEEVARQFLAETDELFSGILAAYVTKDTTIFPPSAFQTSIRHLQPQNYWRYLYVICHSESVKKFCNFIEKIFACVPSSAGLEQIFSTAALIQTKLRNRLASDRVRKLIKVYRLLDRHPVRRLGLEDEEEMRLIISQEAENSMEI
jgi:hypothetical protein